MCPLILMTQFPFHLQTSCSKISRASSILELKLSTRAMLQGHVTLRPGAPHFFLLFFFHSDASPQLKPRVLRATVEQVLMYEIETLTLTNSLNSTLDANYMLRIGVSMEDAHNCHRWRSFIKNSLSQPFIFIHILYCSKQ